jgi:hypothetical protein
LLGSSGIRPAIAPPCYVTAVPTKRQAKLLAILTEASGDPVWWSDDYRELAVQHGATAEARVWVSFIDAGKLENPSFHRLPAYRWVDERTVPPALDPEAAWRAVTEQRITRAIEEARRTS